MNKKLSYSLIIIGILISFGLVLAEQFDSCDYDGFKKECTSLILGKKTLEISGDKYYSNQKSYKEINSTLIPFATDGYDYKTKSGIYTLYLKQNSNWGDGMKYCVERNSQEYCLIYQSQDMSYRNQDGSQDYISNILNSVGSIQDEKMYYNNVFPNVDLSYETFNSLVKEYFILKEKPRTPASYLGEATLDFGGYIKYGSLDLFVGDEEKTGSFKTREEIQFKLNDEVLFYLPKPYAIDYNNETIDLEYEVKVQGQQIWFYVRTPFFWLNDSSRAYPVKIDPSLTVDSSTTLCGLQEYDDVTITNGATITVCEYNGVGLNGTLNFSVSGTFQMDAGTTINGDGKGYAGGSGGTANQAGYSGGGTGSGGGGGYEISGDYGASGGGGAGHNNNGGTGGQGGTATMGTAGSLYSTLQSYLSELGSGGGGGANAYGGYTGGLGGRGGGLLYINAINTNIFGTINTNGASGGQGTGGDSSGGGGGGSGGTIFIKSLNVNVTGATLSSRGGGGGIGLGVGSYEGGGGGGGSGGMIKIIYGASIQNVSLTSTLTAGSGGGGGTPGDAGSSGGIGGIYYVQNTSLFNLPPTLNSNETVPSTFTFGDTGIYFNISASDPDNDSITNAYLNLTLPNGTAVFSQSEMTWISGNSSLGENEIFEGSTFNVTNTTGEVGQWNWSVLIISDGASANATYEDSFTLTDSSSPIINLTYPSQNQIFYRNVSIPLNFTTSDDIEIDSCWYSIDNGATTTDLLGCDNTTFDIAEGTFNITVYSNDTSGNTVLIKNQNITFSADVTSPTIEIINPNGTEPRMFDVEINSTDDGGELNCNYTIKTSVGGDTGINNILMPSCTTKSQSVSVDGDYIIYVDINDSTGNTNSSNKSFSIDTTLPITPVVTGGGGGSSSVIVSGDKGWSMQVADGIAKFEVEMSKGTKRNFNIQFTNLGDSSRTITLSCQDIKGLACQYVEFPEETFELALLKDTKQLVSFTINLPDTAKDGDYQFNIRALDDQARDGTVTVFLGIGKLGIITAFISKVIFTSTNFGFPYAFIFFPVLIIGFIASSKLIKKGTTLKPIWVILISLTVSIIPVMIL